MCFLFSCPLFMRCRRASGFSICCGREKAAGGRDRHRFLFKPRHSIYTRRIRKRSTAPAASRGTGVAAERDRRRRRGPRCIRFSVFPFSTAPYFYSLVIACVARDARKPNERTATTPASPIQRRRIEQGVGWASITDLIHLDIMKASRFRVPLF